MTTVSAADRSGLFHPREEDGMSVLTVYEKGKNNGYSMSFNQCVFYRCRHLCRGRNIYRER